MVWVTGEKCLPVSLVVRWSLVEVRQKVLACVDRVSTVSRVDVVAHGVEVVRASGGTIVIPGEGHYATASLLRVVFEFCLRRGHVSSAFHE